MADLLRSLIVVFVIGVLVLFASAVGLLVCRGTIEAHSTVAGRQVIVRTPMLSGIGIADGSSWAGKPMRAEVGGQSVLVSAGEVDVVGVRKVSLAPTCKKIEIVQASGGLQVFLDGVEAK